MGDKLLAEAEARVRERRVQELIALVEEVVALKQEDWDFVEQIHLGSGHANAHGVEWQFDSGGSWTTMPSEVSSVIHDIHEGYRQVRR